MEHQKAGSQYITGSASSGGDGELDWPGPLELPKSPENLQVKRGLVEYDGDWRDLIHFRFTSKQLKVEAPQPINSFLALLNEQIVQRTNFEISLRAIKEEIIFY